MCSKIKKFSPGRIGVLMGGISTEREVSLKSGKAVYAALKDRGVDAVAIDIVEGTDAEVKRLLKDSRVSVAFLALHGSFGEDGTIQSILDNMGMPFTGSAQAASQLAIDKVVSRQRFEEKNILVPRHYNMNQAVACDLKKIIRFFGGFPLVVKPSRHGSSIGITLAEDEAGFKKAIEVAFGFDENIIIEEFIAGRELTVGILEERPLPVVEIVPAAKFFDFSAKYASPDTQYIVPARIEGGVAAAAKAAGLLAHQALGCHGCSRVDIILDKLNRPIVLEVNTIPGFTATSLLPKAALAQNISFSELCLRLVRLAYEKKSRP